jgi:hypothetical protein
VFGVLTVVFASWRDALSLGILVSNIAIGSFQEIRSKRTLDRLAALVAPDATVVRSGTDRRVPVGQVVVGDLVRLGSYDEAGRLQAPWANALSEGLAIKDIDTTRRLVAELRKKLELT